MTGINAWHLQWYALDGMLHGILSLFDTFWYHLEKSEHSGVLLITIWHVGNFNKHGMNQQSTLLLLSDGVPTSFTGRPLAGTLCRDRMPRPSLRHLFTFHRRFNPFLNQSFCSLKGPNVGADHNTCHNPLLRQNCQIIKSRHAIF